MKFLFILFSFLLVLLSPCQALTNIQSSLNPSSLESLPVQDQGRKKPFFSFAEEFLLAVSGLSSIRLNEIHLSAMQVVTALWLSPEGWEQTPLILVKDKSLKAVCKLPENQDLFSFETLRDNPRLQSQILEAQETRNSQTQTSGTAKAAEDVATRMLLLSALAEGTLVRTVPNPAGKHAAWSPLPQNDPRLEKLRTAYLAHDRLGFDLAAEELAHSLQKDAPSYYQAELKKIKMEMNYYTVDPFRWAWILYLMAGLAYVLFPQKRNHEIHLVSCIFALLGLMLQAWGFVARMLITERPPVTNMYESILWVAFGTMAFGIFFGNFYKNMTFYAGAIPIAIIALILADSQPLVLSPALHPLTAVLQSNFWLTIHVLTITLSYAAFALAMAIAHIVLGKILFRYPVSPHLYNYIYRILQVGVFLLACGTILGGVWANYSWGRFWNWDPKETWALITLLIYLIVLHGRIARKWDGMGLAIGAAIGFLSVLMAWYGVNFVLGTGLHSYGFGAGGARYVVPIALLDVIFIIFSALQSLSSETQLIDKKQNKIGGSASCTD